MQPWVKISLQFLGPFGPLEKKLRVLKFVPGQILFFLNFFLFLNFLFIYLFKKNFLLIFFLILFFYYYFFLFFFCFVLFNIFYTSGTVMSQYFQGPFEPMVHHLVGLHQILKAIGPRRGAHLISTPV